MKPVYFHGIPGAIEDVELAGVSVSDVSPETQTGRGEHLIAFSLGAHRALRYAAQTAVARIDLIAPAAPLQMGDFLPHMAGSAVFRAALAGRLERMARVQGLLVRFAPSFFRRVVFANAPPSDRAIFRTRQNQELLAKLMQQSLNAHRSTYLTAIDAYVGDWREVLRAVSCRSVTLWHGEADTWAPIAMSRALSDALPTAELRQLPEVGHYGALCEVLPRILPASQNARPKP